MSTRSFDGRPGHTPPSLDLGAPAGLSLTHSISDKVGASTFAPGDRVSLTVMDGDKMENWTASYGVVISIGNEGEPRVLWDHTVEALPFYPSENYKIFKARRGSILGDVITWEEDGVQCSGTVKAIGRYGYIVENSKDIQDYVLPYVYNNAMDIRFP